MIVRYNIALIPTSPSGYIPYSRCATENFGQLYRRYCLGENSIPHITFCQFEYTELPDQEAEFKEKLTSISEELKNRFSDKVFPIFIGLNFLKLSGQIEDPFFKELCSIEFLAAREKLLMSLHDQIVALVIARGLKPLNAWGDSYRPHLTLACIDTPESISIPVFPKTLLSRSQTPFVVKLGIADDYWQFVRVID